MQDRKGGKELGGLRSQHLIDFLSGKKTHTFSNISRSFSVWQSTQKCLRDREEQAEEQRKALNLAQKLSWVFLSCPLWALRFFCYCTFSFVSSSLRAVCEKVKLSWAGVHRGRASHALDVCKTGYSRVGKDLQVPLPGTLGCIFSVVLWSELGGEWRGGGRNLGQARVMSG